jgi:hypothetical protein
MKIRPVGAELFHVNVWTDITKVIVAFRNFSNATENRFGRRRGRHSILCVSCQGKLAFIFATHGADRNNSLSTLQWLGQELDSREIMVTVPVKEEIFLFSTASIPGAHPTSGG